eukprot:10010080-Prorocentrum_lima.AAC.1
MAPAEYTGEELTMAGKDTWAHLHTPFNVSIIASARTPGCREVWQWPAGPRPFLPVSYTHLRAHETRRHL